MSAITMKLEDARRALEALKRKRRFKKANDARAEAAELQSALATCRGKLEICKKDFSRTIRSEVRNIAEGTAIGADTTIQEQTLWDAAIGYMMVKDAIYSLKTISTFDSVTHAYDMLGTAIGLMSERQRILPKMPKIGPKRDRNIYGYLTSDTALQQKQEVLDGFFEKLKQNGDIEACLAEAKSPAEIAAGRVTGGEGGQESRWGRLDDDQTVANMPDLDESDLASMSDIHSPT